MKQSYILMSGLIAMLTLSACGKKAEVSNDLPENKSLAPTKGELYFNALKDIETAVETNDSDKLSKAITANPDVDLNQILNDGDTFLIVAIKKNYPKIRNILIDKGASTNRTNIYKETPLIVAVKLKSISSIWMLLDQKIDLDKKDNSGNTALHTALKNNQNDIAMILIKAGANLDITDSDNNSALKIAESSQCTQAYELIKSIQHVEFGAPDIASFRTILKSADMESLQTVLGRYPKIVNDYESINPLAILVDVKDQVHALQSAELLIKYKANVNGPLGANVTPLIKATRKQNINFVNMFLAAKANPQLQDKRGKSALIHAVEMNDGELVNLLLSYSAAEKYTFRKNGKRITYDACSISKEVGKKLKDAKEIQNNKKIKAALNCGFFNWLF